MPRRVSPEVHEQAMLLHRRLLTPKEIVAELRSSPVVEKSGDPPPVLRTVQRWTEADLHVRRLMGHRGTDRRKLWQLEDGDAAIVLPMLAAVVQLLGSFGDAPRIDRDIADWARRIGHEFPDLPPLELYFLSHQYVSATGEEAMQRHGRENPWLYWSGRRWAADLYLAFAPWRDAGARYAEFFEQPRRTRPLRTPSTFASLDKVTSGHDVHPIEWMTDLHETFFSPDLVVDGIKWPAKKRRPPSGLGDQKAPVTKARTNKEA